MVSVREPGLYWVKGSEPDAKWTVARWDTKPWTPRWNESGYWLTFGWEDPSDADEYPCVGPRLEPPA